MEAMETSNILAEMFSDIGPGGLIVFMVMGGGSIVIVIGLVWGLIEAIIDTFKWVFLFGKYRVWRSGYKLDRMHLSQEAIEGKLDVVLVELGKGGNDDG